jgi:hypothetical protein
MKRSIKGVGAQGERGQVLPLTAIFMVVLIGIVGLAIDASQAFTEQRWQRSLTDAASLAGAQDLQRPGRQLPVAADRVAARATAMQVLVTQLGATSTPTTAVGSACLTAVGCALPGTRYKASIYAGVEASLPVPTCLDCVPERAVQVTLWQPSFGLTFSRVLGFSTWEVRAASVAGVVFARQYGVVTLRPTDPRSTSDNNQNDLFITGGSKVIVGDGDVITNTNVVCSGLNSEVDIEALKGFAIYHYDPYEAWDDCLNPPPGVGVTSPIADPGYPIPTRPTVAPLLPTYTTEAGAMDTAANCATQQSLVPATYKELTTNLPINDPTKVIAKCMRPGIYSFELIAKDNNAGPPVAYLLEPGVYFFDYGLDVQSSLIGGYVPNQPGVALVLLEARNQSGTPGQMTTSKPTSLLALNYGDAYLNSAGSWASPANGPQGLVKTPDPRGVLLTLMVVPDPICLPVVPIEPTACKLTQTSRQTLTLTGGGNIFLAGVQYAPTDNVTLKGNSGQESSVGAVWAWTVTFNSSVFNIRTANPELLGVLRLDRGCSPGNICNR